MTGVTFDIAKYLLNSVTNHFIQSYSKPSFFSFQIFNTQSALDRSVHIIAKIQGQQTPLINGSVYRYNDMPIYQIKVTPNTMVTVIFEFTSNVTLRCIFQDQNRPKFYDFTKNYHLITNQPKENYLRLFVSSSAQQAYLAVLPNDIATWSSDRIDFQYKLLTFACSTWDRNRTRWSTQDCRISLGKTLQPHCTCKKANAIFYRKLYVAPNQLNLPRVLLALSSFNAVLVICIGVVLLSYGLAMVWTWRKDQRDARANKVIYLNECDGEADHQFVITVATGLFRHSGTSSKIILVIHGSESSSDPYLLVHPTLKIFQTGGESSFVINRSVGFGQLTSITLQHDSSGRSPSWFCEWVRVRDIRAKEDWIFFVEQWLSLVLGTHLQTSVTVPLASEARFNGARSQIRQRLRKALTDDYLWYSIYRISPRSTFKRTERLTVLTASLITTMLTNIMFFGQTRIENMEDENEHYDRIQMSFRVALIAIQSVLITTAVTFLLKFLFQKSKRNVVLDSDTYRTVFACNDV